MNPTEVNKSFCRFTPLLQECFGGGWGIRTPHDGEVLSFSRRLLLPGIFRLNPPWRRVWESNPRCFDTNMFSKHARRTNIRLLSIFKAVNLPWMNQSFRSTPWSQGCCGERWRNRTSTCSSSNCRAYQLHQPLKWCAWKESNPHWIGSKPIASTVGLQEHKKRTSVLHEVP